MGNAQSRSGEPVGLFCGLAVLDVVQLVDELKSWPMGG